jgi:hypothetical protein
MCDSATLSLIDQEVDRKVQSGVQFTAFDVTLAVQETLKAQNKFDQNAHRHRHLKNDVHRAIDGVVTSGQYNRSLQDVGAPSQAYVYYPVGTDPSTYTPIKRKDTPVVSADPYAINVPAPSSSVAVAPAATAVDDDGDGSDVGRKVDARGSLLVPAFLLRQLGFVEGDQAYVSHHHVIGGDDFLAVSAQKSPGNDVATYTVDYHGCVRLTQAVLAYAFRNVDSYDCEYDAPNQRVVVRDHK